MLRRTLLLVAAASFVLAAAAVAGGAASTPSGERALGQSVSEPVYNDENAGQIGYILYPTHAPDPVKANQTAWAPFYLVVYPVGSTAASTYLCMHTPVENCPTHGDAIAQFAQAMESQVYGVGVVGHDHLMDFPGGSQFNIAWEPIVVLFTPKGAADGATNDHILTDAQISAAVASGNAVEFKLPSLTFTCAWVPAAVYNRGTPLQ